MFCLIVSPTFDAPMSQLTVVCIVAVPILLFVGLHAARLDEVFAVRIEDGKILLRRGRISPALLADFRDVVARYPKVVGSVRAVRRHPRPEIVVSDLPDDIAQRLRNVFGLHALRLLNDATVEAPPRRGFQVSVVLLVFATIAVFVASLGRGPRFSSPASIDAEFGMRETDVEGLARQVNQFTATDRSAELQRAAPFIERLRRTGVFRPDPSELERIISAAGPAYALRAGTRILDVPVHDDPLVWNEATATDLDRMFRALGLEDAQVRCSTERGCIVERRGQAAVLVTPEEAQASANPDRCFSVRVLDRLAALVRPFAESHVPPYRVVLVSEVWGVVGGPDDPRIEDSDVAIVLVTDGERSVLDEWQRSYDENDRARFGRTYPEEAAMRPECAVLGTSTPR